MLDWDQPRKVSGLPGYVKGGSWSANWKISKAWHEKWKAWEIYSRSKKYGTRLIRVEVRKFIGGVAILIKVLPGGIINLSMNGTLRMSLQEQKEFSRAIFEAQEVMANKYKKLTV